ncbi:MULTISPECIES: acyltransferase [Cyanophyceae]|uniref:acyltransferase n=1 Tax=Cyanophyceae TaxID=3028117 RepID=UPI001685AE6B|nr:acyltransferase [Trichocoleus sp. FACHB-69]MBD1933174.1 acyltransferase [Trichocoleus sp. FACHB-69]
MTIENTLPFLSQWARRKESVAIASLGWIPLSPGLKLRKLLYPNIFSRMGNAVYIEPGVKFNHTNCIEIGDKVNIHSGVYLNGRGNNSKICIKEQVKINRGADIKVEINGYIEIGERTSIGSYTCLAGKYLKIGKSCLIASHTTIYASNHIFADPTRKIMDQGVTFEGITIEDDCWLGTGVKVLDGVTIGQGSVIGAGAVVTKDILPYSVAVGVPAKVIQKRNSNSDNSEKITAFVSS